MRGIQGDKKLRCDFGDFGNRARFSAQETHEMILLTRIKKYIYGNASSPKTGIIT